MINGVYVIVAVTLVVAVGVIVTYTLSVVEKHATPLWCYISYTGNYGVERCIFSLVFNLSAAGYGLIVFLRFVQTREAISGSSLSIKQQKRLRIVNLASLPMGVLGSLGLSITGCFQQRIFHILHLIGVFLCTYPTLIYFLFQTYFTYTTPRLRSSIFIKVLRTITVAISTGILAVVPFTTVYFFVTTPRRVDLLSASSTDDGTIEYRVGAILEWILFLLAQLYICSLAPDFRKILLKRDVIVFLLEPPR